LGLLPMLCTHLSFPRSVPTCRFPEIAAELFVSPDTAKTHAVSIYHKLNAVTRGQAVTRARELGPLAGRQGCFGQDDS
jgi:LuxR family maltose regulon positive regulatory protein